MDDRKTVRRIASVGGYGPLTSDEVDQVLERERKILTRADEEELAARIPDNSIAKGAEELRC